MSASQATLLHCWFRRGWGMGREETIDELMAEDCIAHGLVDEQGRELSLTHWKNGKLIDAWNNFDFHLINEQLK